MLALGRDPLSWEDDFDHIFYSILVTFRVIAVTRDLMPVKSGSITIYVKVGSFCYILQIDISLIAITLVTHNKS